MLRIDGSQGEGGGQILRSALGLAMCTGIPFRIEGIRAGREKPGLMRQHLASVNAAAEICGAEVSGAALGSRELTFQPGSVRPGEYRFATGSAGSAGLVLQTVLPPLLSAAGPSTLVLEGGTHNPHAPPFDFLDRAFLPILNRMGPRITSRLERHGFYPRGGGRFVITIDPAPLAPLELVTRGKLLERSCRATVAGLSRSIAEREIEQVRQSLDWTAACFEVCELSRDEGPGNVLTMKLAFEHVTEVVTGFGERGVPAEQIAIATAEEALRYMKLTAPVGEHLADQLLIPFALAGAGRFVTGPLSLHATTNREIVQRFLDVWIDYAELAPNEWEIRFTGS